MNHKIYLSGQHDNVKQLILKCATAVLEHQNIDFNCIIDVQIVTNEEIRQLNLSYRQKDYATDVLSYPMVEFKNGECLEDISLFKDPDTQLVELGDMVISHDKVLEQALEYGHSVEREFAFLTVHSVLHLLGYDHEQLEEDKLKMQAVEKEILKILGITR